MKVCYTKKCPSNADAAAAIQAVRNGKDVTAVAAGEGRHVSYKKLLTGVGPAGGVSKATSSEMKKMAAAAAAAKKKAKKLKGEL